MSKAIEDIKKIAFNIELNGIRCFGDEFRNIIKELERLEAIDNAKPSEALEKLEECANGMKDLPKSNWIDLAENEAELDLKIMDWVETIKFELFKGNQALLELQAIKEAEPSEALECIEKLYKERAYTYDDKVNNKGNGWSEAIQHYDNIGRCLNTIKQALINKSKKERAFDEFDKYITNLYNHRNDYEKKMLYEFEIDNAVIRASTIEEIYNKFKEVMRDE